MELRWQEEEEVKAEGFEMSQVGNFICLKLTCKKNQARRCKKVFGVRPDRLTIRVDDPCEGYVRDPVKCQKAHKVLNLGIVDDPKEVIPSQEA